jgi:transposase-like protein
MKNWWLEDLEAHHQEQFQRTLEALMSWERQQFLKAQPYERRPERVDQANGFYKRFQTTSLGTVQLNVPRTRSGQFQTQVLERYKRRSKPVEQAIKQVFLSGVSTRQTGAVLAGLTGEKVSAGTVSEICKELNQQVRSWHHRPLKDCYEYVIVDGISVRIRLVGAVKRRIVLCAFGITEKGLRELIDFQIVKSESEENWKSFLEDLYRRGLKGTQLKLVVSDGNPGAAKALGATWPRAAHQRCWVHKLRNLENKLKASQGACLEEAKLIYQASHRKEAVRRFRNWKSRWQNQAPKAVACLEEDLEALLAFFDCPSSRWKKIRTTNAIERLFVEVRRRIRTMCSFATSDSCERILYSVFERMNKNWEKRLL